MNSSIEDILESEIVAFNQQTKEYQKLNVIFNIIELKLNSHNESIKRDLYLDLKKMILCYANAIDESYSGYFDLDEESSKTIIQKISCLKEEQQLDLLELLQRKLIIFGYKSESELFDEQVNKVKIRMLMLRKTPSNILKSVVIYASINVYTLAISVSLCVLLYSVILLPAPFEWMNIFRIEYNDYNKDFYLNHLYNTTLSIVGIDNDFKVIPNGFRGVLLLIMIKIFFLAILFNYISSQLKYKLKIR